MQDTVYSLFQKYNCLRMSQVKGLIKDIMSSDEAEVKVSDLLLQGKIICVDNKYFGLTGNVDTALVKAIDIMLILSRPYKLIFHNNRVSALHTILQNAVSSRHKKLLHNIRQKEA